MNPFLALIIAYLLGSIPFGLVVGKVIKGVDVREHGSGNLGATNVFRVVGKTWGIIVLLLDAIKGYLAVSLMRGADASTAFLLAATVAAILGHVFPVWLKFKGGKGVATSLGVFLALLPAATWVSFAFFIVVFLLKRIISLASIAAALLFPLMVFVLHRGESGFVAYFVLGLALAGMIVYTHRANIERLKRGEEKKLF